MQEIKFWIPLLASLFYTDHESLMLFHNPTAISSHLFSFHVLIPNLIMKSCLPGISTSRLLLKSSFLRREALGGGLGGRLNPALREAALPELSLLEGSSSSSPLAPPWPEIQQQHSVIMPLYVLMVILSYTNLAPMLMACGFSFWHEIEIWESDYLSVPLYFSRNSLYTVISFFLIRCTGYSSPNEE